MNRHADWIESCIAPPSDAPEAWTQDVCRIGDRDFMFVRPVDPDQLLNDPAVHRESAARDYMPYWAYLWPGAQLLAEYIMAQPSWSADTRALEIGCGLGLAGLAALASGMHVTFSDYTPAALAVAEHNARLNGFQNFGIRMIDWKEPPHEPFDLILGADVLYEARCIDDVLHVLEVMLNSTGEALLSDPGRSVADGFPDKAERRGFRVETVPGHENSKRGSRVFRVRKRD